MKIIYNHFVPVPGFSAMMLFGVIFARKKYRPLDEQTINHEAIHHRQVEQDYKRPTERGTFRGYCRFYWQYLKFWVRYGYRNIPFEREARMNERNMDYTATRKPGAWKNYL